jgi:hypothetical protein
MDMKTKEILYMKDEYKLGKLRGVEYYELQERIANDDVLRHDSIK